MKKENSDVIYTKETDEKGEIIFDELRKGKYILKETETLKEYKINDTNFDINIECGKQSEITVTNDIIKGWIRIIKEDMETNSVRLKGVQFEFYDQDMNLLETLETDERGETMSKLYPSVNRKYYLKEIKSADGYVLDTELKEITLLDNQMLDIFIRNAREPKEPEIITITKVPEPEVVVVEKEPEVIIKEVEPEPIIEKVIMGEPKVIKKVVKLPKTGM